ncbi:MAG: TlpA family protein disulfide reductase [Polyangiaceae bacterium]|nr:TlpA family protein disulfide reductase [Polyangiaceae bacterium]
MVATRRDVKPTDGWIRLRNRLGSALPYALIGLAAFWLWWPRASGPETGVPAPDFELPILSQEGPRFRLAEQRGTPILIEVFASWCGVCQRNASTLAEIAKAARKGPVRIVAVSVDEEPDVARAAARDWNLSVDVLHADAGFARDYAISTLPTFILVDGSGMVREVVSGPVSRSLLEAWLASVGAPQE